MGLTRAYAHPSALRPFTYSHVNEQPCAPHVPPHVPRDGTGNNEVIRIDGNEDAGRGRRADLAIDGAGFPVHGFVAVAPAFSGVSHPQPDASETARRGVRGVLIVGEHDPYRAEGEEVYRGLAANGVACDLMVEPGISHIIPPGFESRLEAALDVILRDLPGTKPSDIAS